MNGAHDLGGMDGFGPVDPGRTEHFPAVWERQVFALTLACGLQGKWNLDQSRFAREQMQPGHYLTSTYYEHWLFGLETLLVEQGLLTEEELQSGKDCSGRSYSPVAKEAVPGILERGGPVSMETDIAAAYRVGDTVQLRNDHPFGHTRLPRYVRGRTGKIVTHHGAHIFPDTHSQSGEKLPAHLYTIEFTARELWGEIEIASVDSVMVDVFEPYIAMSK